MKEDRDRGAEIIAERLTKHMMAEVLAGHVPDELLYLDAAQALRIARVLAPHVYDMIQATVQAAMVQEMEAIVDGLSTIKLGDLK